MTKSFDCHWNVALFGDDKNAFGARFQHVDNKTNGTVRSLQLDLSKSPEPLELASNGEAAEIVLAPRCA